jgi:protein translocase SecG subunit
MANALPIIQLVLSVLLIGLILLQRPVTDSGALSGGETASTHIKRGLEKTIYQVTILVTLAYIAVSLASLIF